MTSSPASPPGSSRSGRVVWYGALALVVLAGVVAVLAARGSKDDGGSGTAADGAALGQQVADVEVASGADAAPALAAYDGTAAEDPAVGETIPTVTGQSFDGTPITIEPTGKAQILLFVAHWCPHCRREVPRIAAHLAEDPLPDDVTLTTISTAVAEARGNYPPQTWLEDEDWPFPVLVDSAESAAATAFGLSGFPYFVAVDAEGRVVARGSGELSTDAFDELVKRAEAGLD